MINISANAITQMWTTDNRELYAKIFEFKSIAYGVSHYSNTGMFFRLYHCAGNGTAIKDYYVFATNINENNTVRFVDLTPEETRLEAFCAKNVDDFTYTVYVKGGVAGANIKLQILHSPAPQHYKFFNLENFNINRDNISNIVNTTNNIIPFPKTPITLDEKWSIKSDSDFYIVKDGQQFHVEGTVMPKVGSGNSTIGYIPVEYAPTKVKRIPCIQKNTNGIVSMYLVIWTGGKISLSESNNELGSETCFSFNYYQ